MIADIPLLLAEEAMWVFTGIIALVWLVLSTASSMHKTAARERTRREIAAYIAEGSITPEQGERLMKAGKSREEA